MKIPSISCKIEFFTSINPSEDPEKIIQAISNIFPNSEIKNEKFSISATSESLSSFEKIVESIHSRNSQKTYRKHLQRNLDGNSTWIYLNKQAAFANKPAICEEAEESPLGPIKVILTSSQIDRIIDWIAFGEEEIS